jgi:hypothetical protein
MAFDIAVLRQELEAAPAQPELPWAVAVAVVGDTFRLAGLVAPASRQWQGLRRKWPQAEELLASLGRALVTTSLRARSIDSLASSRPAASRAVKAFLDGVSPLTAEMVRTNAFRQEEFLRQWVRACGGTIAGESAAASAQRLAQLDYRQALAEYGRAEAARKAQAARRAQLLKEAREREEQAKGWRE